MKLAAVLNAVASSVEEHKCMDFVKRIHIKALKKNIPATPAPRTRRTSCGDVDQDFCHFCNQHFVSQSRILFMTLTFYLLHFVSSEMSDFSQMGQNGTKRVKSDTF